MTRQVGRLERLLEQINGGKAAQALADLEALLSQQPDLPAGLALRAEALRVLGRLPEAVEAYRRAGEKGAGSRNWLIAGVILAAERKTDDAVQCLLRAHAESPEDSQVLDALVTTLFNANRQREAIEFARRQLAIGSDPKFLANAALLLQSCDGYEEASEAFKRIVQLAPGDPAILGAALGPARFTCEWEWIESLQRQIGAWYQQGNFAAPQEYPLTHLTWCPDEACNLGVTRAYAERTVQKVEPYTWSIPGSAGGDGARASAAGAVGAPGERKRIRVGYLSCDFRNHATMHLMAGLFEAHDRSRFEVFAYDYSSHDISDYRQRFVDAVEHLVTIHSASDKEAAALIAHDQLDILFDLKVYTGGGRPGVLSYRPAPLQAAYIGFPGSAASPYIDYIVSDRFVTPDSSAPYYTEKFCRLPHTYQCNDRKRFAASEPGTRAMHGLPDDKVVFGAFNQSYKIDRTSFSVWLRVLAEVPDSVLWLLGQNAAAIANLSRYAQSAGIDAARLIFAPFAAPREHLARLQLADAILDTLVCNGHTTTSDALWAGVPVITAQGKHFASRVSESLLHAMGVPELVGADHDDMVRIARRIGTDAPYRAALRNKVAANRLTSPLFDTARFTRDFETAIELMVGQQRCGQPIQHIDVPDGGPAPPRADIAGSGLAASQADALSAGPAGAVWETDYSGCPLCEGASVALGFASCRTSALWHEPLPPTTQWMRCPSCGHVHKRRYWTDAGLMEVQRQLSPDHTAQIALGVDARRAMWSPVVEKAVRLLGGYPALLQRDARHLWVDVGCGDGTLVMSAADVGFAAVGLDTRAELIGRIQRLGFNALHHEFLRLKFEVVPDVLSMMDVLDHVPYPREALRKAAQVLRPGGLLILSTPDLTSSSWRALEADKANPYWTDLERGHFFSRERLIALLKECALEVVEVAIPNRYKAQVEIYALRK